MIRKKRTKSRILYKHHKNFLKIAYTVLIIGACLTIGAIAASLYEAHQIVMSNTNRNVSELSQSVDNALQQRIQRTLTILESVANSCGQDNTAWTDDLEGLQERAELLRFEYFAFVSPDGSAVCSDKVSRTFDQKDEIMKAFEGQPVMDVKVQSTDGYEENNNLPFFSVPIYSNRETGEIAGVLAAPVLPQWIFLTQSYYGGDVFFNVIKSDGTEVYMTKHSVVSQLDERQDSEGRNNLFDTLYANVEVIGDTSIDDLKEAAATGRDAIIRFRIRGDDLIQVAQLTHIAGTNLCVWMIDANDAASGGFDKLLHKAFWVNGVGLICFGALIVALIYLYRKNMFMLMVDPVTGGYSLSRFNQEAEHLIHRSAPGDYTLIAINIVHFKMFNDTYGYDESNRLLKHVHNTMLKYIEAGEILSRSSADDFNLLIHTAIDEVIVQKLDLMVDEINRFNDKRPEKQWIMFRAGVYQITDTSLPVFQIRDRANIARKKSEIAMGDMLYSCDFYEEEDRFRLQQENTIKNKMHDALKNHDFKMYLQPKVDISTGKIVGAEALVRWKDTDMGFVPPDRFIPLFEKIGFVRRLDLYMFEQACLCLRQWLDTGVEPIPISVNLSRVHLENNDFLDPFIEIQKKYRIPSELLELELTESAFEDFQEEIPMAIQKIHEAGYACSLDDFGTGYSSLNNLETLDIDVVKLDCKFLREAHTRNDKGHIVIEELIHMARRLGITVCCEGVETEAHLAFLQECHCDKGQGYYFSKPIEVTAFEQLMFGAQHSLK